MSRRVRSLREGALRLEYEPWWAPHAILRRASDRHRLRVEEGGGAKCVESGEFASVVHDHGRWERRASVTPSCAAARCAHVRLTDSARSRKLSAHTASESIGAGTGAATHADTANGVRQPPACHHLGSRNREMHRSADG